MIMVVSLTQLLLLLAPSAFATCENEDGYRPHRTWMGDGGRYASTINLLNEGSSFETGEPGSGMLDGVVYQQVQYQANLAFGSTLTDAYQTIQFDTSNPQHGTRSLKIDLDGPQYMNNGNTCNVHLNWEWFSVPEAAQYDISFYARADVPLTLCIRLTGHAASGVGDLFSVPLDGQEHASRYISGGNQWARYWVRTPGLSSANRYSVQVFGTGTGVPEWCPIKGTTLWLDAVQVAKAPLGGGDPVDFDYHTDAEELFLSAKLGTELSSRWNPIFFGAAEAGNVQGRIEIYQDPAYSYRGGGNLNWKLYALYPASGDPYREVGQGTIPVTFGRPRSIISVNLSPSIAGRYGTYKWIVEYQDNYSGLSQRADRQELEIAVVRSVPAANGIAGNFCASLNAIKTYQADSCGTFSWYYTGRTSLRKDMELMRKLGFTGDREFDVFNWSHILQDPNNPNWPDFYTDLASQNGIAVMPQQTGVPCWADTWPEFQDAVCQVTDHYPNLVDWNLFNEWNQQDWYPDWLLVYAAPCVHGMNPPGDLLTSINDNYVPNNLITLLSRTVNGTPVRRILDGFGLIDYCEYDDMAQRIELPEGPSWWHSAVPEAAGLSREAKLAVQLTDTDGTSTVRDFPIAETGGFPGHICADRCAFTSTIFADLSSGSLTNAKVAVDRFLRHQLVQLGEGSGPIYHYCMVPGAEYTGTTYGLLHTDHTPSVVLPAQVQLNAELQRAAFIRSVPPADLNGPGGQNMNLATRVLLFHDPSSSQYVIVGWTSGGSSTIRFSINPSTYGVTAKNLEGNPVTIGAGNPYFDLALTTSPCYIRVSDSIGEVAFVDAIDHRNPPPSTMSLDSYWTTPSPLTYHVRFNFASPGDVDELRLYYKDTNDPNWACADTFAVWAHPDSGYVATFAGVGQNQYQARASAIERTTGDEVFSAEWALYDGGRPASAEGQLHWVDRLDGCGPNPAHGPVRFTGTVAAAGRLRVRVHDVEGRTIRTIEQLMPAGGRFDLLWDGNDDLDRPVASGQYWAAVEREGVRIERKQLTLLH